MATYNLTWQQAQILWAQERTPWVNWWPGDPNTDAVVWPPQTISDSGSYSIGGGAVAPVPQGPQGAAPTAADPKATEFETVPAAAEAALGYFAAKKPEQPIRLLAKVLPQSKPVTVDTLEYAIRELNPKRAAPLDIQHLTIGLREWGIGGLVFQIEGVEKRREPY